MGLRLDTAAARARMQAVRRDGMAAAERVCREAAAQMQTQARGSAPWRDRTGAARRAITGEAARQGDRLRCGLRAGAPHSAYLEYGREGRYAVLGPVLRANAARILAAYGEALR